MNRHSIAFLALAVSLLLTPLFAAEISDAEWASMKEAARARVRRVLYENDGDDCLAYPGDKEPSIEGYLSIRTSYLQKYPYVSTVFYTPTEAGFGHVSLNIEHSDQLMVQLQDFNPSETRKNIYPYLKSIGTDTLTEQVRYAHAHGLEIFCDIRTNDIHDSANRPNRPHALFSALKKNHPEWLYGTWDKPTQYGAWSSIDYDVPEFRQYFIGHVTDIANKYDVDGISFDFHRWPTLFRTVGQGAYATDAQRAIITDLFRQVRAITEKAGRAHGRVQLIAVRVPDSVGYCWDMGIDLEGLMREGLVDIVIPGGNFRMNPWKYSVDLCKKYGVKCYPSIDMPQFMAQGGYRLARGTPATYFARIASALQAGAEGTYFFNMFSESAVKNCMRPDLESIRLENKRYHLTDRWLGRPSGNLKNGGKYNKMPEVHPSHAVALVPGTPQEFLFEFGDDIAALKADGHAVSVNAIVKTNALRENALRITSNGQEWEYTRLDDEFLYYRVPDGALLPGENTLTIEANRPQGQPGVGMVTIMTGKTLLYGDVQPPWRRLWERERVQESEAIEDGAYRLIDFGRGMTNFYYPLHGFDSNVTLEFQFRLAEASDEFGAGLRIANGRHCETLLLMKDGLRLLYDGAEAKFNTTDAFHTYRVRLNGDAIYVEVDGKRLLEGRLTVGVNDERAEYKGAAHADGDMHVKGLVLGSLSDEGTSTSYWKEVKLRMPAATAPLLDLVVDVKIAQEKAFTAVQAWAQEVSETASVAAGNHAYSRDHIAAEIDFDALPPAGTRLIVSNGGTAIIATFNVRSIDFLDGSALTLPTAGPFGLKFEENGDMSLAGLKGGKALLVGHDYVTTQLNDGFMKGESAAATAVMRNSGVVLLPPKGVQATTVAKAIRYAWFVKPVPLPDFMPVAAYDSADGLPDGAQWRSSYVKTNISLEKGLLRLNNEHQTQRWQSIAATDMSFLDKCGDRIGLSTRFSLVKPPAGKETEFYTIAFAKVANGKTNELIIRIGPKSIATSFGSVPFAFAPETSNELFVDFDMATSACRMWLNGNLILKGTAKNQFQRDASILSFGDGSASCAGIVDVENLQIGTVKP